jgi:CheY-like chemotaxis protein
VTSTLPTVTNRVEPSTNRAGPSATVPSILIVEDEVDLAATCVRFLRRFGYRLCVAHTGPEALTAITADRPDLVVTDLRLPGGLDGLAVVRHVRQQVPPIAVIVCTAQASDRIKREALEAGAMEYLAKPFTLVELHAAVDRALGQNPAGDGYPPFSDAQRSE